MKLFNLLFNLNEQKAFKFLIVWVIILSILYSLLAILRHDHFQSGAFDLGIYDQAVWQYSHFEFPYNTIKERFILGDHLTLTLPLLAPLFYIWDDVRTLLIFQAVFITLSTIAVYKIALLRRLSPFVSLIIGIVYPLFYGIQTAASFDFHPIVIAVGILVWTAYLFEAKKWKAFWISLILLLSTQENTGVSLAGLGFIYLFYKQYRKEAGAFIFGGLLVSLIQTKIIGLMSPIGYQYTPQFPNTLSAFITGFFDSPEKIENWKYMLIPTGFLPLLSLGAILAVLMDLSQYYLTGFSRMWTPFQHHRAMLAPFIALGLIEALIFLKNKKINIHYVAILVLVSTLVSQYIFHFPINKLSKGEYSRSEQWMIDNNNLFEYIPGDASVASAQNLVPHLSHRNEIYLAWPRLRGEEWWLEFSGKPEYLVVDLHPGQWLTQLLESNENFKNAVKNMGDAKKIKLVRKIGEARIYKIIY